VNPECWKEIERIFQLAADLPPEDRPALVERESQGDQLIRREVLELLEASNLEMIGPAVRAAAESFSSMFRSERSRYS
jgi:hypothetical protein